MKVNKKIFPILLGTIFLLVAICIFGVGDSIKGVQDIRFGIDIRGGVEAVFEAQNLDRDPTSQELETARAIIETRLDAKNITDREVTIDKKGGYIIVRFPWKSGEKQFNPEDAIAELGEMAQLTFQDENGTVMLKGKHIKTAKPVKNTQPGSLGYEVSLTFDSEGASLFQEATKKLLGKKMPIYMDDQLISAPTVESEISGGQAVINNLQSFDEAKNLADKINAGALPFSLATTNFSTISPSLGNSALNIMVIAGLVAFLLVCIFMIIYYKLPGVVACLTLLLQMALQLLSVSIPQATLTLPGIAGIILSLGMAVDANIIIAERISEELKSGLSVRSAIKLGYKHALSSVLDGNITTAIVAIILMILGSGTMLSFGYTLLLGMIWNVVIGVAVSKYLLLSLVEHEKWRNERCFRKKTATKIRKFYEKKWLVLLISGGFFLIGIGGIVFKGVKLDTQFTGGVVLNYSISQEVETEPVKKAVETVTNRPVTVQITKNRTDSKQKLLVTLAGNGGMSPTDQKKVTNAIETYTKDSSITLAETYSVEPYIGAKAWKNSQIAVLISVVFITLYVWIRFSALHGLVAGITSIIALLHDVLIVFFTFVLFGIPINDAFVAVVLTIIGYSINDTIVLYDRIRENQTKSKRQGVVEHVNIGISQTLARSINTSLTTGMCVLILLAAAVIFQIGSIFQFALPMLFGLISGCYSSVCIASILWAMWEKKKEK